jgi:hypothetical protein
MTKPLSSAAQAILDAYGNFEAANTDAMAAALRAAADQVVPLEPYYENCDVVREELLDISAELEAY